MLYAKFGYFTLTFEPETLNGLLNGFSNDLFVNSMLFVAKMKLF